ncbi:MAG: NAD(P)-dependent oxidoreductase [Bacteroidia bacterium]|nr:MAG: NAD(P)-dependent oxidoreductase [Bacteroidia bacterium]
MTKPVLVITGASGFLGSAVCIDLAKDFIVIAIDRREPSEQLRRAAPQTIWHILDIADNQAISEVFALTLTKFGQIDFVIHFAAYYDFGKDWVHEYQRTNVEGTAKVINASKSAGVKRLIFASSIAAMEPPASASFLTEESPTSEYTPYARSKSLGERLLEEACSQVPCIILRIAGVFSDWGELPPLYSLIKLWTSVFPFGRMIPGRGGSGIPYIHLIDLVRLIRKCILLNPELGPSNIFLASQHGAVHHRQLFQAIRSASDYSGSPRPIYLPEKMARFGVWIRYALGKFSGNMPVERSWMLDYLDKPWTIDTSLTRRILDWDCTPELDILRKIPDILSNLKTDPKGWEERNKSRNERRFQYSDSLLGDYS